MAVPLSDTFSFLLEAAPHDERCGGTLASCDCRAVDCLWAVSNPPVPLVSPGRWSVFPRDAAEADAAWVRVRDVTQTGRLGFATKLSFRDRRQPAIIVYVADQWDLEEGSRVRSVLRDTLESANLRQLAEKPFKFTSCNEKQVSSLAPERNPGGMPCRHFGTPRGCKNGDSCRFLHERRWGGGGGGGGSGAVGHRVPGLGSGYGLPQRGGIRPAAGPLAQPRLQFAPVDIPPELREILMRQERQLALLAAGLVQRQQGERDAAAAASTTAAPVPPPAPAPPAAPVEMCDCVICMCESPLGDGIMCQHAAGGGGAVAAGAGADAAPPARRHFVCRDCMRGLALAAVDGENIVRTRGAVRCPGVDPACTAPPWPFDRVLPLLVVEDQAAMLAALQAALGSATTLVDDQARRLAELEASAADREAKLALRQAAALAQASREDKLRVTRLRLVEDVLTLHCPRCHTAFVDYEGCIALTCARAGCGCGFCAICLKDCARDAHAHCTAEHGSYYPLAGVFERETRARRLRELQAALDRYAVAEGPEFVAELRAAMERDLRDVGINARADLRAPPGAGGGGAAGGVGGAGDGARVVGRRYAAGVGIDVGGAGGGGIGGRVVVGGGGGRRDGGAGAPIRRWAEADAGAFVGGVGGVGAVHPAAAAAAERGELLAELLALQGVGRLNAWVHNLEPRELLALVQAARGELDM